MSRESKAIHKYKLSKQNYRDKLDVVNTLRHILMDDIKVDVSDDKAYMRQYECIMSNISCSYPFLSDEVQRQVRKKKRRQARRSDEKRESNLHI